VNRLLWNKLRNSLLLRLGGMIAAITMLAIVGMSTSWMVAETTQGNYEGHERH
jgi:two-component system nitrate/nitrite sensor histidine kinase NarX